MSAPFCTGCGATVAAGTRFCVKCGQPVGVAAPPPASTAFQTGPTVVRPVGSAALRLHLRLRKAGAVSGGHRTSGGVVSGSETGPGSWFVGGTFRSSIADLRGRAMVWVSCRIDRRSGDKAGDVHVTGDHTSNHTSDHTSDHTSNNACSAGGSGSGARAQPGA